jgi:hypothetical protein
MKALTVEKATGTFVTVTFLVESAICTLSKILLLTKERASTPVIYARWDNVNKTRFVENIKIQKKQIPKV